MTDILLSVLGLVQTGIFSFALVVAAMAWTKWRKSETVGGSLAYRSWEQICLIAAIASVITFLVLVPISEMRVLPNGVLLAKGISSLSSAILVVGVAMAYRRANLSETLDLLWREETATKEPSGTRRSWVWFACGMIALFAAFAFLEWRQPFYFTQDDNLSVNLAEIVFACRSAFAGVFPTWNPHQFLGTPNTTLGWYALTYPPTYLSYWIARSWLGNEFATLDVFSILHLTGLYAIVYAVIRREGCRPSLAMVGSLWCALSGYALIFSRSWFQFSAAPLWAALMVYCVQSLVRRGSSWKWIASYGAVVGAAFHAGHIQMWVYSVLLADVAIFILMFTRAVPTRAIISVIAAHFVALAIAAPLLVPEVIATSHVLRTDLDSNGIGVGVVNLFVPSSIIAAQHPTNWGKGIGGSVAEMYYSGTLFAVLCAVLMCSYLCSRWTMQTVSRNIWLVLTLIAFVLALGSDGFVWTLMKHLPGFNRFRFPFKFLAYIILFSPIAGAVVMERWMRARRWITASQVSLASAMLLLLGYHVYLSTGAFYGYGFAPYPQPPQELATRLAPTDGTYPKVFPTTDLRLGGFSDGGFRGTQPMFVESYMNQWPTVFGAYSISGYNPLVAGLPSMRRFFDRVSKHRDEAFYEYGVKYVLQYDGTDRGAIRQEQFADAKIAFTNNHVRLIELLRAKPMAFVSGTDEALPVKIDGGGATIDTSTVKGGGSVVLNVLLYPQMIAEANGRRLEVAADEWERVKITVPAGTNVVAMSFRPEWKYGFALSLLSLMAGAGIAAFSTRQQLPRQRELMSMGAKA